MISRFGMLSRLTDASVAAATSKIYALLSCDLYAFSVTLVGWSTDRSSRHAVGLRRSADDIGVPQLHLFVLLKLA